jgi:hypothetical protein
MNTQVSFPLAVLLKEKGFSWKTGDIDDYDEGRHGYFKHNKGRIAPLSYFHFETNHNGVQWTNLNIPAPTIGEVVIWLYEKHGIWIGVIERDPNQTEWEFQTSKKEIGLIFASGQYPPKYYNSPTEAYEAAIEYTLKNLI